MRIKHTLRNTVVASAIAVLTATSSPLVVNAQAETPIPTASEIAEAEPAEIEDPSALETIDTALLDATDSSPVTATSATHSTFQAPTEKNVIVVRKNEDGWYHVKVKIPAQAGVEEAGADIVTLKRDATVGPLEHIEVAKFEDYELQTAYAFFELMEKDYDLYSFNISELTNKHDNEITFRYIPADAETTEEDQARSWAFAKESDSNAFIEGFELEDAPVARMAVADSSRNANKNSPLTPNMSSEISVENPRRGWDSIEQYSGQLSDPDFGEEYEKNPSHMNYNDRNLTYPIRHRNWCTDYYNASSTRPLRGPYNPQSQGGSGLDCRIKSTGEQGAFYSRDHVQYAWAPAGNGTKDPFYRAHEFLIGGGDDEGVWYGGRFRAPSGVGVTSRTHPVWDLNYRNTGKPGFQVYIDGVLNTDDPGWRYIAQDKDNGGGLYFISPDNKLGIKLESAGGSRNSGARTSMNFRFYNHEKLVKDGMIDDASGEFTSTFLNYGKSNDYRVGIKTPGWRRAVIRYGTGETGKKYEPVSKVNGYRSAGFIPQYSEPTPKISKSIVEHRDQKTQSMKSWSQDSHGNKYIDYEIKVSVPKNYLRAPKFGGQYFWYKVIDQPNFGPNMKVTKMEVVDVVGKGKDDFEVITQNANTNNPTFTLQQAQSNESEDHLQIGQGKEHLIKTRVYFETVNGVNANTIDECRPGNGLYNQVTLNFEKENVATDEACGKFEEHEEVQFGVLKVDHAGQFLSIDSGFNFEVRDPQGNAVSLRQINATGGRGGHDRPLTILLTEKGSMKTGVRYQLVETRAPVGHELLAEPIYFTIVQDNQGQFQLEVEDLKNHPQVVIRDDRRALGQNVVTLHVADIRSGDLPQSGGSGVYWQLCVGAVLIAAAGALSLRRRN